MPDWRWLRRITLRFRTLLYRDRVERELDEEFQFYLENRTELEIARGRTPAEARLAALRAIDGLELRKEECRDMRHVNYLDDFLRDLKYAARSLRRSPGFAALATLVMALGIGANTAVFSVVNGVLLKPLAYRDPDRIVTVSNVSIGREATDLSKQISIPDFDDWRRQSSSFEAMAYYASREGPVIRASGAEYARVTVVSPEFLRVFAMEPVAGRFFTAQEMTPGHNDAALISYAYSQSRFGGAARALGQTIRIYGPRRVVGVLPPGFGFPNQTDLWIPIPAGPPPNRGGQNYLSVARLKPGVPLARAQTEMTSIARRLEQAYPETNRGRSVAVARIRDEMVGNVRLTLYLLLGAVGLVLMIACANTATLLLAKATARTREVAVRASLGASRRRILRQLITEGLLLASLAGGLGLLFAYCGSRALVAIAPQNLPRLSETGIDRWVLAFTAGVSVITSLLFGLVPALYASKIDLSEALKQGTTRVSGGGMVRMRGVLVVAEMALAVMLVSGAGLLLKSFVALHNVALGFTPENVLVMKATVPGPPGQAIPRARQFFRDFLTETAALPGVVAAGATMAPPGHVDSTGVYFIDHMPPQPDPAAPSVVLSIVAPGTFAALGIPLKSGRDFSDSDRLDKPFVAVVNEALVRRSFPNQNPLGRTIFCPFDSPQGMTIIGIVGDVRQRGPELQPMPECYMTYEQHAFNGPDLSVVARTVADPYALADTLRRLAREKSPNVPMKFTTLEAVLSENVAAPRFRTQLFAIFAVLAVCLAIAGIYGVTAFAVGRRANELGLRIALGASPGSVVRLVLGQGIVLAALGLILGLAGALAGARLLTGMLFGVQPGDPAVYLGVAVLLGIVAVLAGYIPARRAAGIDPLAAIREE